MNIFSAHNDVNNDVDEVKVDITEDTGKKEVRHVVRKPGKKVDNVCDDIKEEHTLQSSVQNPYYGSNVKDEPLRTERSRQSQNSSQTAIISCTSNIYYEV